MSLSLTSGDCVYVCVCVYKRESLWLVLAYVCTERLPVCCGCAGVLMCLLPWTSWPGLPTPNPTPPQSPAYNPDHIFITLIMKLSFIMFIMKSLCIHWLLFLSSPSRMSVLRHWLSWLPICPKCPARWLLRSWCWLNACMCQVCLSDFGRDRGMLSERVVKGLLST